MVAVPSLVETLTVVAWSTGLERSTVKVIGPPSSAPAASARIENTAESSFWIVPVAGLPGVLKLRSRLPLPAGRRCSSVTVRVSSASTLLSAVVATLIVLRLARRAAEGQRAAGGRVVAVGRGGRAVAAWSTFTPPWHGVGEVTVNTRLPPSATETLPIDNVAVSSFWIVPVAGLPGC